MKRTNNAFWLSLIAGAAVLGGLYWYFSVPYVGASFPSDNPGIANSRIAADLENFISKVSGAQAQSATNLINSIPSDWSSADAAKWLTDLHTLIMGVVGSLKDQPASKQHAAEYFGAPLLRAYDAAVAMRLQTASQ